MNYRCLLILGALLMLTGCAGRPASEDLIPVVYGEPLLATTVAGDSVTIRVMSTGCTTKKSFLFFIEPVDGRQSVGFLRNELDLCKAAPSPIDLTWTFEELDLPKGASVTVLSPYP